METVPPITIPQQRSILDCRTGLLDAQCSASGCRRPVPVRWVPRPWDEISEWQGHEEFLHYCCHTCAIHAAPARFRLELAARFAHILEVRKALHLRFREARPNGSYQVVEPTMTYTTWQQDNRAGANEPFIEEFWITVHLPEDFDDTAASQYLAPHPLYRLQEDVHPWASAYMAFHARVPTIPQAHLEWHWDQLNQLFPPDPVFRGFHLVSVDEAEQIARHGQRLISARSNSSGRYPDDKDSVCSFFKGDLDRFIPKLRGKLDERSTRPLSKVALAKAMGMHRSTLDERLKSCSIAWDEVRHREK